MNTGLTLKEESTNAIRALLKGIPYLGATLDQFTFGRLEMLRHKRLQATMTEIAERLKECNAAPQVDSEQFVNLLETVVADLVRSTEKEKREGFRDLLLNAAVLPPSSTEWEEAKLAAQLLSELEAPALAVLANVARYMEAHPPNIVILPRAQVVNPDTFTWNMPSLGPLVIGFDWPVVQEWAMRLKEKRLIGFAPDARGGFTGVVLTDLGKMLVAWTVGQRSTT